MAAVSIVDSEKRALRPIFIWILLRLGLHYVKNDCHSVLVVVAHDTLVCVGTIRSNYAISLSAVFSGLVIRHQRFDKLIWTSRKLVSKIFKEIFAWYVRITLKHHRFLDLGIGECSALAGSKQRTCIKHLFCVKKWRCALSGSCVTSKTRFGVTRAPILLLRLLGLTAHIHRACVTLV